MEHTRVNPYTTPAISPPPGVTPNFVNPPSTSNLLVGVIALCLTISIIAIALRTFVKACLMKQVDVEDYALVLAGASFTAFCSVSIATGKSGLGKHMWDISMETAQRTAQLTNWIEILYGPTMFLAKLCVMLQIQRIFHGSKRDSVFWSIQVLIWSNFMFYTAITITFIAACVPREKIWNPVAEGHCISTNGSIIATSVINIMSDISILLLPVFAVWKLKIAFKRKMLVSAIFSSGLLAVISSTIRIVYSIRLTTTNDALWILQPNCVWGHVELTTVILAGSIPVFPRLFNRELYCCWKHSLRRSRRTHSDMCRELSSSNYSGRGDKRLHSQAPLQHAPSTLDSKTSRSCDIGGEESLVEYGYASWKHEPQGIEAETLTGHCEQHQREKNLVGYTFDAVGGAMPDCTRDQLTREVDALKDSKATSRGVLKTVQIETSSRPVNT